MTRPASMLPEEKATRTRSGAVALLPSATRLSVLVGGPSATKWPLCRLVAATRPMLNVAWPLPSKLPGTVAVPVNVTIAPPEWRRVTTSETLVEVDERSDITTRIWQDLAIGVGDEGRLDAGRRAIRAAGLPSSVPLHRAGSRSRS
jgi:hypothetical protein